MAGYGGYNRPLTDLLSKDRLLVLPRVRSSPGVPIILIDGRLWVDNFLGFFTREEPRGVSSLGALARDIPRYAGWGAPILFLYARGWIVSRPRWGRELVFAVAFLVLIVLPGGGAYWAYALVFCVWHLGMMSDAPPLRFPLAVALLVIAPFWTHYFPTFQSFENPRYGETVRTIMAEVETYSGRTAPGTVWVSTRIGQPIIDEAYARVLANYVQLGRYPAPITLGAGDVVLYLWPDEAEVLFANYAVTPETVETTVVVPPVRGLLTFESGLRARLPDVGLWRVTPRGG